LDTEDEYEEDDSVQRAREKRAFFRSEVAEEGWVCRAR
jgi:hypothetical protein